MSRSRGRAPSQRQLRMGELVRHALVEVLNRGQMRDPVLADTAVTVTEVRVSPDLRQATVYVVPLGGGQTAEVVRALAGASGYFQAQLGSMIESKFTPRLVFRADESFDSADRVDALIREARARSAGGDDGQS